MNPEDLRRYRHVWLVDFEYKDIGGPSFEVHCVVAKDFLSGQTLRVWQPGESAPYDLGADSLFVSYNAIAEMRSHISLGWPIPKNILDLYPEYRLVLNGLVKPEESHTLLRALAHFGIEGVEEAEKTTMRDLAIRGGPFTEKEAADLLAYCETDVAALERLLPRMLRHIDLPRALTIRGRYMAALAKVETNGVPIDTSRLGALRGHWNEIKQSMIGEVDKEYRVYEGTTFKTQKFLDWLARQGIAWPELPSGAPALDADTFRSMAKSYPELENLRELRDLVSRLKLHDLAVGPDGRNRCFLNPFGSVTGRNQPSNAKFIFGPSRWIRGLIKPTKGNAIAYIDYEQQEFGIGASLSNDQKMMDAYRSGDPYLAFGKQAGAIPPDGTKATHKNERKQFKQAALGIQYGMGGISLGYSLGESPAHGQKFIRLHRETYPNYWRYSEAIQDRFYFHGEHTLSFGWRMKNKSDARVTTLRNFPFQGNGAEMLRLAIILAIERGVKVCAPIHDALLIEAPVEEIEQKVADCEAAMREASELVLPGFPLRTEHVIVRYPDRYMDEAGESFWNKIWGLPFMAEALRGEA